MNKEEKTLLKEKIKTAIQALETEIATLEEDTKPVSPDNSIGRLTRMDAINNKSVAEANLRTARKKLSALNVALITVDTPDFGICKGCGKAIQVARLMYMPESTRCVHCAQ